MAQRRTAEISSDDPAAGGLTGSDGSGDRQGRIMSGARFIRVPQRSAEWLALRQQGIGASDVPAVLGLSPYKSRLTLWLEKRGEIDPAPVGAAADRGVILEDAVATMYSRQTGRRLRQSHGMYVRRDLPWMYASLDRLTVGGDPRIIEIKTSASPAWSMHPVPLDVVAQVRWQMAVTGLPVVDVAALLGGLVFRIETVERDLEIERQMIDEVGDFWQSIVDGVQPDATHLDTGVLGQIYRGDPDETIYGNDEAALLLGRYLAARTAVQQADQDVSTLEVEIKEMMQTATRLDADRYVATWREAAGREIIDWESIARKSAMSHSDLDIMISNYRKVSAPVRRFVVKEKTNG